MTAPNLLGDVMSPVSTHWPSFKSFWLVEVKTALYKGQTREQKILRKSGLHCISPTQIWKIWSQLLYPKFKELFARQTSKMLVFYVDMTVNTPCYRLRILCTTNVQSIGCFCCRRQIVENICAYLSQKFLLVSFSNPKFNLKSWVPSFL